MIDAKAYEIEFIINDDVEYSFLAPCPPEVGDIYEYGEIRYVVKSRSFNLDEYRNPAVIGVECEVEVVYKPTNVFTNKVAKNNPLGAL